MQGIWVVLVNTVIFLAFANMLHRYCVFAASSWSHASRHAPHHRRLMRLVSCSSAQVAYRYACNP